ncbi:amino acid permease [Mycolicibacterium sp. CBM1]
MTSTPKSAPATGTDNGGDDVAGFGYKPRFQRTIKSFDSFALAFSFISITTGIFSTFGFVLLHGGPRGIWTWPIVIVGQLAVAVVYGALAARIPLAGYSYQWGTRLANWHVGWWLGWVSMCFLFIVVVSVDYAFVQVAFQPLIGQEYTPISAALWTTGVIALQAGMIVISTKTTARINTAAVVTEIVGVLALIVALVVVAAVRDQGSIANLWSSGSISESGYYAWLGPFMLCVLLGGYTVVGFEAASNLAEETENARQVVPRAMVRAVVLSGVVGMALLMGVTYAINDIDATTQSAAPLALLTETVLGAVAQKALLVLVCISIFACGLINLITNTRLIWAMGRDGRLPGHRLWRQAPRSTAGPTWATYLAAGVSIAIVLLLANQTDTLVQVFSAATLMPALLYFSTVVLFVVTSVREGGASAKMMAVAVFSLVWLAFELCILLLPAEFRTAQYYLLGALGIGLVVYLFTRRIGNITDGD